MKEKLNLRNAILWTVTLVALILFFASFGATARLRGTIPGEGYYVDMKCVNAIWGCKSIWDILKDTTQDPSLIRQLLMFLDLSVLSYYY